jgi:hypothetical protein
MVALVEKILEKISQLIQMLRRRRIPSDNQIQLFQGFEVEHYRERSIRLSFFLSALNDANPFRLESPIALFAIACPIYLQTFLPGNAPDFTFFSHRSAVINASRAIAGLQ